MLINADLELALIGREELIRRVKWYIKLRWIFLISLSIIGIFSDYLIPDGGKYALVDIIAFSLCLAINLLLYFSSKILRKPWQFALLALFQILFDIFISCYVVYAHGGVQSRTLILYAIPIIMAGALFGSIAAYIAAFLSAVLYSLTLLLGLTGWASQYVITSTAIQNNVLVPILFYTIVFFILAGLGDFVSGINARTEQELAEQEAISLASHQLRTPATAVKGFLASILSSDRSNLSLQQLAYIEQAYKENERELQLVDTMLLVAQADSKALRLHKVKTDLVTLIDAATSEQSANLLSKKQQLTVDKPQNLWCTVDAKLLRIVIDNLLDNACKYTPLGGAIHIALAQTDHTIHLSVQDSGIGIAKKDLGKLFKRYSRIASAGTYNTGGSGLGLYLTKKILTMHQGSITVAPANGHGTIFNVELRSQDG